MLSTRALPESPGTVEIGKLPGPVVGALLYDTNRNLEDGKGNRRQVFVLHDDINMKTIVTHGPINRSL